MNKDRYYMVIYLFCFLCAACDLSGPHDNPVDPNSSNYLGYPIVDNVNAITLISPANLAPITGNFTISKCIGATAYQIDIGTTSAFSTILLTENDFTSNKITFSNPAVNSIISSAPAAIYWRARGCNANGQWGNFSSPQALFRGWTDHSYSNISASGVRSVAYGKGIFVAVSSSSISTSSDGITWIQNSSWTNNSSINWSSVTFGGGVFVAVSDGSGYGSTRVPTSTAAISPDGVTWTAVTMPSGNWGSVTYGNGIFVAIENGYYNDNTSSFVGSGLAATSADGISWTAHSFAMGDATNASFENGLFIATGTCLATSSDGISWIAHVAPDSLWYFGSVAYGNGLFVTAGWGPRNNTYSNWPCEFTTSSDGITWVAQCFSDSWQHVVFRCIWGRRISCVRGLYLGYLRRWKYLDSERSTWLE